MRHYLNFLIALVLIGATFGVARADDEKKYNKMAAELRQQVWSDDSPEFTTYTCPEKYLTGHSAVILASSTQVELTRKSYIKMRGFLVHPLNGYMRVEMNV